MAGTTVIHGEGIVGITMMLPQSLRISSRDHLTVEAGEGTQYVFTAFRSHDGEPGPYCHFCITNFSRLIPEWDILPYWGSCYTEQGDDIGCLYQARPLELYFVTDGPATLTIRLPQLSGSIELTATAEAHGFLEKLPVKECLAVTDDCTHYGGVTRTVGLEGRPAMGGVVAYIHDREGFNGVINPGLEDIEACAYPGLFGGPGSPDPADHPTGCDDALTPGPHHGGEFTLRSDGSSEIHGPQYVGFKIYTRRTLANTTFGAWGRWLEAGMICASGDFHDCAEAAG
ncbi:MAG TPA: hypothetical protein VGB51_02435 [Actinomycetota bacterium]